MNHSARCYQRLLTTCKYYSSKLVNLSGQKEKLNYRKSTTVLHHHTSQRRRYRYYFLASISFIKIFQSLGFSSEEYPEVKKLLNRAKEVLQNGNEKEALDLYNQALVMAVNVEDTDDIYYIKEKIAVILFNLKKYADSEKLFLEVEEYLSQKGVASSELRLLYITLRLAEIYDNLKDYEKAEQRYKTCGNTIKSRISTHADSEVIEFWLLFLTTRAHYHLNRGTYEKASKYFAKAYETCLQTKGEMNEQTVILLQQLGSVCYQKGDLEKAVMYLKKATDLGKHLPGLVQLSNAYVSLGNILLKQGLTEDARTLCNQGLKNAVRHKYEQGIKDSNACLEEVKEATSFT